MSEDIDDYLNNNLSESERLLFEKKMSESVEFNAEVAEQKVIWDLMSSQPIPEPSEKVSEDFYVMLESFKKAEKENIWLKLKNRILGLWEFEPRLKLAYSIALLLFGLTAGIVLNKLFYAQSSTTEIATLSAEVKEMKEMMMLSLLEDPSASERIRAVSFTQELTDVNEKVIEALFVTLNNDDNDNVRIMTLEALATIADDPRVRQGLVASISKQDSPLVQVAMADVMVMLQEKNAVNHFKKLLRKKDLNEGVKMKIEQSLLEII